MVSHIYINEETNILFLIATFTATKNNKFLPYEKITLKAFNNACVMGNLTDAKKLLFDNPHINIFAYNKKVFCNACANGHLEMVKWLLQLNPKINISKCNEEAFRHACATSDKYFCTL